MLTGPQVIRRFRTIMKSPSLVIAARKEGVSVAALSQWLSRKGFEATKITGVMK